MRRFVRYGMVGAIATAAHYLLLVLCVERANWPAWLASGAGAVLGAQVAFLGNRWFTFSHQGTIGGAWMRFHATALAAALLGMVIVGLAVWLGLYYVLAQMLATGVGLVLTFVINQRWTFR